MKLKNRKLLIKILYFCIIVLLLYGVYLLLQKCNKYENFSVSIQPYSASTTSELIFINEDQTINKQIVEILNMNEELN